MKTQLGNDNAYYTRDDNPYAWFDWGAGSPTRSGQRMHDFVRQVIQFRKDHEYVFAPTDYAQRPEAGCGAPPTARRTWNWNGHRAWRSTTRDTSGAGGSYLIINMDEAR